jgi:glycine dehydrogenase subunit 1
VGAPTIKEFVIRDRQGRVDELLAEALTAGFLAGVPLRRWYPEFDDCFLVAVTEKRTRAEIDALVATMVGENKTTKSLAYAK